MKTKVNLYILVNILIISVLGCKKEEVLTPEKLIIGRWKITNIAKYKNSTDPPVFDLSLVNGVQKYNFEITDSKFSIIDITSNNKVVGETIYFLKDGLFYGSINSYIFLGYLITVGRKVTFESNNKMMMRVPQTNTSVAFDEFTYSRIQ